MVATAISRDGSKSGLRYLGSLSVSGHNLGWRPYQTGGAREVCRKKCRLSLQEGTLILGLKESVKGNFSINIEKSTVKLIR